MEEVKVIVPTLFKDGIRKLMDWSNKCVEKLGNYVKKWLYLFLCTFYRIKKINCVTLWISLKL